MKRVLVVLTAAALAAGAYAAPQYEYAGTWGRYGYGNGEFRGVFCIAVAPNGNVYVTDGYIGRVQYFTPTGSYLGQWSLPAVAGIDVSSRGTVYFAAPARVEYFTLTGSLLGWWGSYGTGNGQFRAPTDVAVAPNGDVYVVDMDNERIQYFTSTGSFLGKWGSVGTGPGKFDWPAGIAVASNGNVYVVDTGNYRVQYFTPSGSFLGMWGKWGEGPGEFDDPDGIDVSKAGIVFVANTYNHRVDYFTSTGSYLGIFGGLGTGPGQFALDYDAAVAPSDTRIYVTDWGNFRVQYFDQANVTVEPTSLGRVKALFK